MGFGRAQVLQQPVAAADTMDKEKGECPICGEVKPLEVWHRPLPYQDRKLTRACSECYIQHLWPVRDYED